MASSTKAHTSDCISWSVLYKGSLDMVTAKDGVRCLSTFCSFSFRSVSLDLKEQKALTAVRNAQHRIGRVGDPDRTDTHDTR
jgi:hypothetical protein